VRIEDRRSMMSSIDPRPNATSGQDGDVSGPPMANQ